MKKYRFFYGFNTLETELGVHSSVETSFSGFISSMSSLVAIKLVLIVIDIFRLNCDMIYAKIFLADSCCFFENLIGVSAVDVATQSNGTLGNRPQVEVMHRDVFINFFDSLDKSYLVDFVWCSFHQNSDAFSKDWFALNDHKNCKNKGTDRICDLSLREKVNDSSRNANSDRVKHI